jgi:hypothetical protein
VFKGSVTSRGYVLEVVEVVIEKVTLTAPARKRWRVGRCWCGALSRGIKNTNSNLASQLPKREGSVIVDAEWCPISGVWS